ncbi:hypothetical protein AMELA_G00007460 [Ameiurus melas]|uniref:Uncharacterized protein n=1 Tax=Ameiurus melas TaxID=219545 RepID=A0A7J6BIA2_AMEME|nr:hypothetical protein AMELA_G00007460 [Ameiurus melas]
MAGLVGCSRYAVVSTYQKRSKEEQPVNRFWSDPLEELLQYKLLKESMWSPCLGGSELFWWHKEDLHKEVIEQSNDVLEMMLSGPVRSILLPYFWLEFS